MTVFKNDKELFQFIQEQLYVAAVCDILDEAGYRNQAMHQRLRPLLMDINNCGFVGRARTFHWIETDTISEEDPYGLEIEAMDSLKAGDVVVISTDYNGTNAPWGELMSTISKNKGVVEGICDSQVRDCVKIIEMNFPVFYASCGHWIVRAGAWWLVMMCPFNAGGLRSIRVISSSPILMALWLVPKEVELEVFIRAKEKVASENHSRLELQNGSTLRDVYNKYKSL